MLNKLLATVGIGSAKVDTILDNDTLTVGDEFSGVIKIYGGNVEQDISGLKVAIVTKAEVERDDSEHLENIILQEWHMEDKFTISPNEEVSIPFSASIDLETPITENGSDSNKTILWVQTGLEIDLGLDASDKDRLYTTYTPVMKSFMEAMRVCGFYLYSADVEKGYINAPSFSSKIGVYQELEFRQSGINIFGFNEVEISFIPNTKETNVMIEIDRRFSGDKLVSLTLDNNLTNVDTIVAKLKEILV